MGVYGGTAEATVKPGATFGDCDPSPECAAGVYLTDEEKSSNSAVMVCCSGSLSGTLVLDL